MRRKLIALKKNLVSCWQHFSHKIGAVLNYWNFFSNWITKRVMIYPVPVLLIPLTCLMNGHARLFMSQNVLFCMILPSPFIRQVEYLTTNVLSSLSLSKFWSTHWNGDNWVQYNARHLLFFNSMIHIIGGTVGTENIVVWCIKF